MIILHGENLVASRKRLTEEAQAFVGEVVRLEGGKLTLSQLKQAIESASLFGKNRLVVLENLFSLRPSKNKESLLKYLKKAKPTNLIIWERKKIDGRRLTAFGQARVEFFSLPSIIFKFLDSLNPKNKKTALNWLHRCLAQQAPEIIFYMLCRQTRYLIIAADLGAEGLGELPGWQKAKYLRQAKLFGLEKLLWFYQELFKIDYQQKTGKTPFSLASQLDVLVASV